MINKIGKSFNRAKYDYQQYAVVQQQVWQRLIQLIYGRCNKKSINTLLELGCGNGKGSLLIAKKLQLQRYDAVDCANQLIDQAIADCKDLGNLSFYCLNFDHELQKLPANYDMIVANMSLHWSNNINHLLSTLQQKLSTPGYLCISMPLQGTFAELSPYFRINSFSTDDGIRQLLYQNNFNIIEAVTMHYIMSFSSKTEQLHHLRKTGVNCYVGNRDICIKPIRQYLQQQSGPLQLSYAIGLYLAKV